MKSLIHLSSKKQNHTKDLQEDYYHRLSIDSTYISSLTILHSVATVPHKPTQNTDNLPDHKNPGIANQ